MVAVMLVWDRSREPRPEAPNDAAVPTHIGRPTGPPAGAAPTTVDAATLAVAQAAAVDRLLSESVASRRKLGAALRRVHSCQGLSGALADLAEVGAEREGQLAALRGLDLSALPEGEGLRALLSDALTHSLNADRSYVRWAEAVMAGSCPDSGRGHLADGDRASESAGRSKTEFLAVWNAVAAAHGLQVRTREDI